jgi:glucose-1-phosphate thymidylyltransferase
LAQGGEAAGVKAGAAYVDVGTLHGYRAALRLLESVESEQGDGSAGTSAMATVCSS